MASSFITIKYAFGENVDAISWSANWPYGHMDDVCKKILTEYLSAEEIDHLKEYGTRLVKLIYKFKIRDKKQSFFNISDERAPISYYLAPDLECFENALDVTKNLAKEAYAANAITEDLMKSMLRSVEVLRKVARFYNIHWTTKRRAELDTIAKNLQKAIDDLHLPNLIKKIERTLRGSTGFKDVNYYIVDNKYPGCSARHYGCQKWIVGWSDPPKFAAPEYVVDVVCGEALHLILWNPFTEEQRLELAEQLRASLDRQYKELLTKHPDPYQRLFGLVDAAGLMLMEGYGHTFIGFPWIKDDIPKELPEPRQMGREGTPYFESYHFTKWFHDHWTDFLENPSMNAKDWAWQCVKENMTKFLEIARRFLEIGESDAFF